MKRAVIFAHYEKDGLIPDYVVYYLKELKKVAEEIIFVSCKNITEKDKLDGLTTFIIDEEHDEYDFGSYKRGFLYLLNRLNEFDEIVFANDSCYGPIYPIENIFKEMEQRKCDFWGITENKYGLGKIPPISPHVQSYFFVIKKHVFTQEFFINFIKSIKKEENKELIIINYEIGLSELLVKNGYKYDTFIKAYSNIINPVLARWRELSKHHKLPLIKKSLFDFKNTKFATIEGYEKYLKNYPLQLIKLPRKIRKYFLSEQIKTSFFHFLTSLPLEKRAKFTRIMSKYFNSIFRLIED